MSSKLFQIVRYLKQLEIQYKVQVSEDQIITGFTGENVEYLPVLIQLSEERKFLRLYIPQLLKIKGSVFKGVAFQTMLALSYEMKLLRFEYDPIDGEVRASIELPIEDGTFTFRQFQRCLLGLVHMVDREAMPRLKAVLATGEDPGTEEKVNKVAQLIADSDPETLELLLEQAVALRKLQNH